MNWSFFIDDGRVVGVYGIFSASGQMGMKDTGEWPLQTFLALGLHTF